MTKNEELDFTLQILIELNVNNSLVSPVDFPHSDTFDIPEIEDSLHKLVSLGFAGQNPENLHYWATYDGRKFLEDAPKYFFKNQPFKYLEFTKKLNTFWTFVKTIGLTLNSIAILYLMYLTILVSDKSNKLEFENQELETKIESKLKIIESLKTDLEKSHKEIEKLKQNKLKK